MSDWIFRLSTTKKVILQFGDSSDPVKLLRLEHPRTGEPAQYLLNTQINKIYQILTFTEEHRAWFIGQLHQIFD